MPKYPTGQSAQLFYMRFGGSGSKDHYVMQGNLGLRRRGASVASFVVPMWAAIHIRVTTGKGSQVWGCKSGSKPHAQILCKIMSAKSISPNLATRILRSFLLMVYGFSLTSGIWDVLGDLHRVRAQTALCCLVACSTLAITHIMLQSITTIYAPRIPPKRGLS